VCYSFTRENGTPPDCGIAPGKGNAMVTMGSVSEAVNLSAPAGSVQVIRERNQPAQ